MTCKVEKENEELKQKIKDLEKKHKEDMDMLREMLSKEKND